MKPGPSLPIKNAPMRPFPWWTVGLGLLLTVIAIITVAAHA